MRTSSIRNNDGDGGGGGGGDGSDGGDVGGACTRLQRRDLWVGDLRNIQIGITWPSLVHDGYEHANILKVRK